MQVGGYGPEQVVFVAASTAFATSSTHFCDELNLCETPIDRQNAARDTITTLGTQTAYSDYTRTDTKM